MSAYSKQFILSVGLFIVTTATCSAQTLMLTLQVDNVNQAIKGQIPQGKNYFEITPNEVYNGIKIEGGYNPGPRLTAKDEDKSDLLELSNIVFVNKTSAIKTVTLDFTHKFTNGGPAGEVTGIDYINGYFVGPVTGLVRFQGDVDGKGVRGEFDSFQGVFKSDHNQPKMRVNAEHTLHGHLYLEIQPNASAGIHLAGVGLVPEPSSFAAGCLAVIGTSILALRRTRRKSGEIK